MQEEIGTTAGAIWQALTNDGELSLTQLKRQVQGTSPVFDWAIGWLAREDQIVITKERRSFRIRLKEPYAKAIEDAARSYEGALKLDERNEIVWGNLGDAYYWAPGRRAQAASVYQKASAPAQENLQVNPRDTAVLGRLAHFVFFFAYGVHYKVVGSWLRQTSLS